MELHSRRHPGLSAKIDDSDYDLVSGYRWNVLKGRHTFYATANKTKANGARTTVSMHRLILPGVPVVDHINGNGLDNRRSNLRGCTVGENSRNAARHVDNASGFKGVYWNRRDRKWKAQICVSGEIVYLGYFDDKTEAAKAYDAAAIEHHGTFARLNLT